MPTTLFFFLSIATISATVFFVSFLELVLTYRRRRIDAELILKQREMRAQYNLSLNQIVLSSDAKLLALEKERNNISEQYQTEQSSLTANAELSTKRELDQSHKELERAKKRAKKMEGIAEQKADEYFKTRQTEVEAELMDLVLKVTKEVLPESLEYNAHKELVMQALQQVRSEEHE